MKADPASLWLDWLYHSFSLKDKRKIGQADYRRLRTAQTCLWQALNLYDDFLDGGGRPLDLPKANEFWRRFLSVHYQLPLPAAHAKRLENLCRRLRKANEEEAGMEKIKTEKGELTWPKKWPCLPGPEKLSEKSLLLSAGPLALASLTGKEMETGRLLEFFRYSLSAKQLSDDACDWQEDLEAGKLSLANLPVLKYLQKKNWRIDIKKEAPILKIIFAKEAAPIITRQIISLCSKARLQAKALGWPKLHPLLIGLIQPLETAAAKAMAFRRLLV